MNTERKLNADSYSDAKNVAFFSASYYKLHSFGVNPGEMFYFLVNRHYFTQLQNLFKDYIG